ncbi:MAG: tyrosine-type recombinase/integrase [bacterium]|nr:tyrosine-type recombinase/integrase [Clostridium sp.]MCM1538746.1 tyrosine-type recombinase/integrase [bacterium]
MSTTYPIRNEEKLERFKDYFLKEKPVYRNYAMIVIGLNTAFRIGDLLNLKWEDVFNRKTGRMREHICVTEQKTGKERVVAVNAAVAEVLEELRKRLPEMDEEQYLFPSVKKPGIPLSRSQAFRIIREAAEYAGIEERISCHSLRKTFGYQAWRQGVQPAVLMDIYNHSSYRVTKRYLGIEQEDRDRVYLNLHV